MRKILFGDEWTTVFENSAESIRARPKMYLEMDDPFVLGCVLEQCLCVTLDQALDGRAKSLLIEIDSDNTTRLVDDGTGFPLFVDAKTGERSFSLLLEALACRTHKENTLIGERFCSAGIVVSNALSERLLLQTALDGEFIEQAFYCGAPAEMRTRRVNEERGTRITYRPDPACFPGLSYDKNDIEQRIDSIRKLVPADFDISLVFTER